MSKINKITVLLLVIVGGLILSPTASATPSQGAVPNKMYPGTATDLTILAGINPPHTATEIAVWDAAASPIYGVTCPLPGPSGGVKWELRADNDGDGDFTDDPGSQAVGYNMPAGSSITIVDFGDGGSVAVTPNLGATVDPASPSGGYQWQDVSGGLAGTDSTDIPGVYEFASCGVEGAAGGSDFVGTTTFQVISPSTILTKEASAYKVLLGETVTYWYYEENDGTPGSRLADPYVEDDMCDPVEYVDGDDNDDGYLDVGETFVYTCSMVLDTPGEVTNTAYGHGWDPLGNDVTYPEYPDEMASTTVMVLDPGISLEKVVEPSKVVAGTEVTYTYTVTNTGNIMLDFVQVMDDQYGPIGMPIPLPPGESWTWTHTATISESITNIATATGAHQLGEVYAEASAYVEVIDPGISLIKEVDPEKVVAGTDVTYTYTVTNEGDTFLDVTVTDDQYGLIGTVNDLAPGDSAEMTHTTTISESITNIATAIGEYQLGEVYAEASAYVEVIDPGITVEKTCSPETQPEPGTIDWVITVTNTGDVPLDVVVDDSMHGQIFSGSMISGEVLVIPITDTGLPAGDWDNFVTALGTHQLGEVSDTSSAICTVEAGGEGCTPGYWKNHPDSWVVYTPDQTLEDVFDVPDSLGFDDVSLMEALNFGGGKGVEGGAKILLRAAVASLLNSANPDVSFTMTTDQIISSVNAALASEEREIMLDLATDLDYENNMGCPID